MEHITLNGQPISFTEEWVCACSGEHMEDNPGPTAKCSRKGGEYIVTMHTG